ncbi:UNVERIFIED_CONTAM: hypothetical protein HDU68_005431 [Siphonaria sp. JEL0065]|nr:hypothetical protein HDU68_005431 [Siphonaria sp. JEL0065]
MKASRSDPFNPYTSHPRYLKTDGSQHRPSAQSSRYATFARLLRGDNKGKSKFNSHRTSITRRSKLITVLLGLLFIGFLTLCGRQILSWFLGHHLVVEHVHNNSQSNIPKHSVLMAFQSSNTPDSFARRSLVRAVFRNYTMSNVKTSKLHLVFYWDQHSTPDDAKIVEVERKLYSNDILHSANTFDFLSQIHSLEEYDHIVKMNQDVLVNFEALNNAFHVDGWTSDLNLNSTGLFVSRSSQGSGFDSSAYILSTNLVNQLTHSADPRSSSPAEMKKNFERDLVTRVKELGVLGLSQEPDKSSNNNDDSKKTKLKVKSVEMNAKQFTVASNATKATDFERDCLFIVGVKDLEVYMKGVSAFMV